MSGLLYRVLWLPDTSRPVSVSLGRLPLLVTAVFTPVTWKGTFVLDDELARSGSFGVKDGNKVLNEMGANLKVELNYDIMKNVNLYSRLNLFTDYMRGKEAKNIDVSWDVQLNMTINKWLSASVSTNLVYDQ